MMDNNNTAEDGQHEGQNLQLQHQRRKQSPGLKEPRPYRRRIKPLPTKVYHVHPDGFRRFVQSHTSSLLNPDTDIAASAVAAAPVPQQPVPANGSGSDQQRGGSAACAVVSRSPRSMQGAYMAWCSSNDIPLSPGTMAELTSTMHQSDSDAAVVSRSPRSMQEAYMAWCSSNDIPLSPGTMAELTSTMHQSDSDAAMASISSAPPADHVSGAGKTHEQ